MLTNQPSLITRFMLPASLCFLLGCSETDGVVAEATASIVFHTGKIYIQLTSVSLGQRP